MKSVRSLAVAAAVAAAVVVLPAAARSAGGLENIRPTIVFTKEVQLSNGGFISTDAEIYTIDSLDHVHQLTEDAGSIDHMPAFSPDGTRIAFVKQAVVDEGQGGIYLMDSNGLGVQRITNDAGGDSDPAWSPDGRRLAFASNRDGDYDIFVLDLETGTATKLTDNTVDDGHPSWSPDGTKIAFDSLTTGTDGNREIYVMNADGTGVSDLTQTIDCDERDPDWSSNGAMLAFEGCNVDTGVLGVSRMNADGSGQALAFTGGRSPAFAPSTPIPQSIAYSTEDGELCVDGTCFADGSDPDWQPTPPVSTKNGKVVFASDRSGDLEIWSMDGNGANQTQLTASAGDDTYPVWSPTGAQIAFASARTGDFLIHVMAADGSSVHAVTSGPAFDVEPSWSPDGKRLAFASDRGGALDIFTIGVDGSGLAQLTSGAGFNADPEWSPDGTQIVFTSSRTGHDEVFLMNADGTNPHQLTTSSGRDYGPYWSPDGKHIAFQSERNGNSDIYAIDPNGTNERQLTSDPGTDSSPAWSPDGTSILFHSNRDGDFEVFVMGANGLAQAPLTSNTALDKFPDWQPVVTNADVEPPLLSLPANRTVDATSPAGAVVSFSVTATDDVDPLPVVSCSPGSGSTFPIGTTTVACTASDATGNTSGDSFTITVRGAAQQLSRLADSVLAALGVPPAARNQLLGALASLNTSNPAQKQVVCARLQAFAAVVRTLAALHLVPPATASDWIAQAARIRAVLGC